MAHTRLQHMGQKGWGLVATAHIPAGELVIEYVGEVVDDEESARRVVQYEADGLVHTYIMTLSSTEVIDATRKGNLSRFINHSCDANCETQKWVVSGDVRVCVVARRKIRVGEEITYNYNLEWNGQKRVRCVCGAANCHKYLGGQSKRFRRLLEQGPVLNQEVLQFNDEDEEMVAVDVLDMFSSDDEEAPTLAPSSSLAICSGVEERGQHGQHAPRASQPPKRQRRDADDQSVAPEADRLSTTLQPAPKAWDDGSQQRPQLCTAVAPSQQSRLHPAAGNASLFEGDEQSTALQAKPHLLSTTQASLQSCASALMQQSASSPHRSLSAVTPPGFQAPRVACSPISAVSLLAAEAASQQAASSLQRCPSQCPSELLPQASRQHGAPYAQPRPQGVSEPQAGPSLEPLLPQVHVLQHYSSLQSTASQRPAEAPHAVQLPGSPTDAESYISPSKLSRLPTRAAKMWRARQLQPTSNAAAYAF
ncbi:hypothetical protein WJX72_005968 [[Myrmecia] bisecta]|uniref:Uncharacterized protein n=1 Tax=[Myrmecia] bisecta TaxID=41462 RepID=A0AAW1QRM5_9CHLO